MKEQQLITTGEDVRLVAIHMSVAQIREAIIANIGPEITPANFGRFRIPPGGVTAWPSQDKNGEESVKELVGVIVGWRFRRAYWSVPMEQSHGATAPDCQSRDARRGEGNPGGDCGTCRFAPKDRVQPCKLMRDLFFLRPGNVLPEVVCLPRTSQPPAQEHFNWMAKKGLPYYGLFTKIGLEKVRNDQGMVYSRATFSDGDRLTSEQAEWAKAYAEMLRQLLECVVPVSPLNVIQRVDDGL
jgi:hypothetical protein